MEKNCAPSGTEVSISNHYISILTAADLNDEKTEEFCDFPNYKNINIYRKIIEKLLKCYEKYLKNTPTVSDNEAKDPVIKEHYVCQHCEGEYVTKLAVRKHLSNCEIRIAEQESAEKLDYLCAKCRKTFNSSQNLKYHMTVCQIYETSVNDFSTCNAFFQTKRDLNKHLMVCKNTSRSKNCTGPTPFKCKLCEKSFQQARYLANHIATHSDFRRYKCKVCKRAFKDQSCYNRHTKTHSEPKFICAHCGMEITRRTSLKRHLGLHARGRLFKCYMCGKSHENNNALLDHLNNHPPIKKTRKKPKKCSSKFLKRNFKMHTRIHLNMKRFDCKPCGKSFNDRDELVQHFVTIHTSGKVVYTSIEQKRPTFKEFKCDTCKKTIMYRNKNIMKHVCKAINVV